MAKEKPKGKIVINQDMCKSCEFCVEHCPTKSIAISEGFNDKGYHPAEPVGGECTGCALCALVCPEAVIEVWRE